MALVHMTGVPVQSRNPNAKTDTEGRWSGTGRRRHRHVKGHLRPPGAGEAGTGPSRPQEELACLPSVSGSGLQAVRQSILSFGAPQGVGRF